MPTTHASARRRTRATTCPSTSPPRRRRPVVIGTGPCGLLAALTLAEMGFRPLILERGKLVRERTRDTWGLWRRGVLNPESNVQFGEGGAGTFSDGKLYSGIKDPRHLTRKLLTEFVAAGAPEEILTSSKPHIGTFRLVTVVEGIRAKIESLGGEYRFSARVEDIETRRPAPCPWPHPRRRGTNRRRPCHPGDRPQRARHLRHAAPPRRAYRSEGVLDRRPYRAPAIADRPRSVRRLRRPSAARRRRLQAGAPRQQRTLGLQLLHVPGRARRGGDVGDRLRRHQRHEPVFARRVQRQRRHRRRHHAGRLPRRRAGRRGIPAGVGTARVPGRRRRLRRTGQLAGDLLAGRASVALGDVAPSYKPQFDPPTWPPACRASPSRRSARRCGNSTATFPASPCTTRC